MADIKQGTATSEFLTSVGTASPFLYTALASTSELVQCVAMGCVTLITCTYVWSRTKLKKDI